MNGTLALSCNYLLADASNISVNGVVTAIAVGCLLGLLILRVMGFGAVRADRPGAGADNRPLSQSELRDLPGQARDVPGQLDPAHEAAQITKARVSMYRPPAPANAPAPKPGTSGGGQLWHVYLPNGEVSEPMPPDKVMDLVAAGEISLEAQVCEAGSEKWQTIRQVTLVGAGRMPGMVGAPPTTARSGTSLGDGLMNAAVVFFMIGLILGLLLVFPYGLTGFVIGFGSTAGLAVVLAIIGGCLK